MDATVEIPDTPHRVKRGRPAKMTLVDGCDSPAQVLALRIWAGQSPDISVTERVSRIAAGLKAQGFSLNVELPHADAGRYLEAHK